VLRPWSQGPEPPLEVLVLGATLRQQRHDFDGALEDLASVLARDPRNAQAWLTRAVILQVRGEPDAARRACLPLLRLAGRLVATTCLANAASLSGEAERSYTLLRRALAAAGEAPLPERAFAVTSLAEMAARLGRRQDAEAAFREALALAPGDAYLLAARADLLLDQGRPAEVVALLEEHTRVDGLLLRLALAEKRLGSPDLAAQVAHLAARFAASRRRGDALHRGEEARFALELLEDPEEALRLAHGNFAVQREPRDARLLLEAALAAREPEAAGPALELLERTALEDAALRPLAARLEALR
jgi:Tfp pilus assembly protein PilF